MNKKTIIFVLIVVAIVIIGVAGVSRYVIQNAPDAQIRTLTNTPASVATKEPNNFTASFEIYTNGTRRIFTAAMYHNQSPDVFIQNSDPYTIYVKKNGVTWMDFFNTLPFSLTKECLITGTNETFCNTKAKKLRFFLNDIETPDALSLSMQPGDSLLITYGN